MVSGFAVATTDHLIRSELWSNQLKELLLDDLFATRFVKHIEQFPDGEVINIPSLGEAETLDYSEGSAIKYNKIATGNFQFSWEDYVYSATSMTQQFKQDSFYADQVLSTFVPKQHRAIMERVEASILSKGPAGQTANDLNVINGAAHRFIGGGTGEAITKNDFARAWFALRAANVPMTNLIAIVDPSVAFTIMTETNITNLLSPDPQWQSVVKEGLVTGMQFKFNIYGFDVYVSNYLPRIGAQTIDSVSTTVGVANLFFSAAPGDTMPIIGGFKQMPTVYSEFNKDLQQDEYLTIARFGYKLYRPENMVVVITDTDVVS